MMNQKKELALKICGPAGSGVMQLGEVLSLALNKAGFYTLAYPEYPSVIRGGDNNIQIVISPNANLSPRKEIDILFALDETLLDAHRDEVKKDGFIFDGQTLGLDELGAVKENPIVKNTVAAGFIWKTLSQDLDILLAAIKESMDEKYVDLNLKAAQSGYNLESAKRLDLTSTKQNIFGATANEVFAKAIVKANCKYASIYPITPINSLLNFLSQTEIKMVTPEDEIFAVLSTIGASYAGVRSVTATSGAGFSLMSEAVGFSSMAEIPLVVILGQRSGPSSGMPTYTGQTDLNFAINPGHGEFEKIVLAPGDLKEAMSLSQEAFNMADKYQVPVIVLTDKYLSESRFSTSENLDKINIEIDRGRKYENDSDYRRYKLTKDGISPRAFPGETTFATNSYEHDEAGFAVDDIKTRNLMLEKRNRKLQKLSGGFEVFGNKGSDTILVGWGSTKNNILEYLKDNNKIKYIHVWQPWPFSDDLKNELLKAKKTIVIENNSSGQMANLIECNIGLKTEKILKDDGRPFFKEELAKLIDEKL